jgi:hypothetical protein
MAGSALGKASEFLILTRCKITLLYDLRQSLKVLWISNGKAATNVTILISLKSGKARGRNTIRLRPEAPSGLKFPDQLLPVLFEGEDRGVNLILNLNLVVEQEGVYWFDVLLEEQLLTRIPLRVLYQRIGQSA